MACTLCCLGRQAPVSSLSEKHPDERAAAPSFSASPPGACSYCEAAALDSWGAQVRPVGPPHLFRLMQSTCPPRGFVLAVGRVGGSRDEVLCFRSVTGRSCTGGRCASSRPSDPPPSQRRVPPARALPRPGRPSRVQDPSAFPHLLSPCSERIFHPTEVCLQSRLSNVGLG